MLNEEPTTERIESVFITISIAKVDFETDKKNHLDMFKAFSKNLEKIDKKTKKIIVDEYHIVMEYGATGDNPHLHIYLHFTKTLNWTQINRIVKYPSKKVCNPLRWSRYSCKSKIARNVPYLLCKYLIKESSHTLLKEKNIDWISNQLLADKWIEENLHKLPLHLKHISISQLPYRILDYSKKINTTISNEKTFIKVIEDMIKNKYNLFTMYRNNSLLKQTYSYIVLLQEKTFNYLPEYRIDNTEIYVSKLSLFKQIEEKQNEIITSSRELAKLQLKYYNEQKFKK